MHIIFFDKSKPNLIGMIISLLGGFGVILLLHGEVDAECPCWFLFFLAALYFIFFLRAKKKEKANENETEN